MTAIRFERDGAIGTIVLANPPFNRLDLRFAETLRSAVHEASGSDIRVLVVRSEGPHFSFGGEVREWPGKDVNWFRTFVADVNISYRAIEMLHIPTVAVVQGVAFGGGFELALACDFGCIRQTRKQCRRRMDARVSATLFARQAQPFPRPFLGVVVAAKPSMNDELERAAAVSGLVVEPR